MLCTLVLLQGFEKHGQQGLVGFQTFRAAVQALAGSRLADSGGGIEMSRQ